MGEEEVDYDPWVEREEYLAEGHEDLEVETETVVPADEGDDPDLSEHTDE